MGFLSGKTIQMCTIPLKEEITKNISSEVQVQYVSSDFLHSFGYFWIITFLQRS